MKLGEIAVIQRGINMSKVELNSTNNGLEFDLLNTRSINNGRINHSLLTKTIIDDENDYILITKENDIVIKLNVPYDSALILKDEKIVVPSSCAVISCKNISPKYLLAVLNQRETIDNLVSLNDGMTHLGISKKALENLDIPRLGPIAEDQVANLYDSFVQEKEEFNKYISKQEKIVSKIIIDELKKGE